MGQDNNHENPDEKGKKNGDSKTVGELIGHIIIGTVIMIVIMVVAVFVGWIRQKLETFTELSLFVKTVFEWTENGVLVIDVGLYFIFLVVSGYKFVRELTK